MRGLKREVLSPNALACPRDLKARVVLALVILATTAVAVLASLIGGAP